MVSQFAASSTVKNMQKMQCQSMLSCELKSLLISLRNTLLANRLYQLTSRMPGQAGVWKGWFCFQVQRGCCLWAPHRKGMHLPAACGLAELQVLGLLPLRPPADPALRTKPTSLVLFSYQEGSERTGLKDSLRCFKFHS